MDDLLIIERVLAGDQRAFQVLVERYQNYVFTISLNILKKREVAEEVAQDVFLKVFRTLSTFEGKSKFSTWIYTITYRTAIDYGRKNKTKFLPIEYEASFLQIEDVDDKSPVQALSTDDLKFQLNRAINQLKPTEAAIITLFYLHENTVAEIAQITGLTITNIKTKLHRTRARLKKILNKQLKTEIEDLL